MELVRPPLSRLAGRRAGRPAMILLAHFCRQASPPAGSTWRARAGAIKSRSARRPISRQDRAPKGRANAAQPTGAHLPTDLEEPELAARLAPKWCARAGGALERRSFPFWRSLVAHQSSPTDRSLVPKRARKVHTGNLLAAPSCCRPCSAWPADDPTVTFNFQPAARSWARLEARARARCATIARPGVRCHL